MDEKYGYIKGLSDRRRLPLLGKIRLGIKIKNDMDVEYPKETDYLVCPEEVKRVYGEYPKVIDVMLPVVYRHIIFPTAYRFYGKTRGLKCIGNGETAMSFSDDKKEIKEKECPCELLVQKKCGQRAFLMAILPQVNMGGVYQISTGSYNSIVDINSGLDYIEALIGRVQMIPLKLSRELTETNHEGKKQKHYTLKLRFEGGIEFINQLRENNKRILVQMETIALPAPIDENPELDQPDVIESMGIRDEEKLLPAKPEPVQEVRSDPAVTEEDKETDAFLGLTEPVDKSVKSENVQTENTVNERRVFVKSLMDKINPDVKEQSKIAKSVKEFLKIPILRKIENLTENEYRLVVQELTGLSNRKPAE